MNPIIKKIATVALSAALSLSMFTALKAPIATNDVAAATYSSSYSYEDEFNDYKQLARWYISRYQGSCQYSSVKDIRNSGIRAINSITYNPNRSLYANEQYISQIVNMVIPMIDKQINVENFEAYKAQKMTSLRSMAGSNPTAYQREVLSYTQRAFNDMTYNDTRSYQANISNVDRIAAIAASAF